MANPAPPAWATSSVTFMQATVVDPDARAGTLSFVDASGRTRSHAVAREAAARVGRLRPGDEVIVVLSGADPVVQDVRLPRTPSSEAVAPPADAAATAPPADDATRWTVVPAQQMRPSWPNPYSRFHRGPKPKRP
jgi:hypothetical protein